MNNYISNPNRRHPFQGGRGQRGPTMSGRPGPRPMGGQPQRQNWQRPPMQPGRWQPQRQHAPEAYYSEEQMQNTDIVNEGNATEDTEETFQFDNGEPTTEDELISQWNDNFFSQDGDLEEEEEQCGWQDYAHNSSNYRSEWEDHFYKDQSYADY